MYRESGEVDIMAISYRKLWIQLIDRNMNKTELREVSGITTNALAALGKDERVTTDVLNKICLALKCDVGDIMEILPDEEYKKMIEMRVLSAPFVCRTKDLLWYRETKQCIELLKEGKTLDEIKELSQNENIFNAASSSRADNIRVVTARRVKSVNEEFLDFFTSQDAMTQKQLCIVLVMLTDRTFYEFMNNIFREKMILGVSELFDSDLIGFVHRLQESDERIAKWSDAAVIKVRDNYKHILKEAEFISESGTTREIVRPIVSDAMKTFLQDEGLTPIYKILAGENV